MSKNLIQDNGVPGWLLPLKRYRGSPYTKQTWDDMLNRLADGQSLAAICRMEHMPEYGPMLRFIHAKGNEAWLEEYREAQRVSSEKLAEKADLAVEGVDEDGNVLMEDVQRSKLRRDHYVWKAGVYNKERYGPKSESVSLNINLVDAMDKARARVQGVTIQGEVDAED